MSLDAIHEAGLDLQADLRGVVVTYTRRAETTGTSVTAIPIGVDDTGEQERRGYWIDRATILTAPDANDRVTVGSDIWVVESDGVGELIGSWQRITVTRAQPHPGR